LFDRNAGHINLCGGGPLLYPDLINIIRVTRKHFSYAMIEVVSNGILLLSRPANKTMHKRPLDLAGGQDAAWNLRV